MRSPVILAAVAALGALALPAAAGAKEITALEVCGTDGCTRISDRSVLRGFEQGGELAEAPPAGRHRSYALRVRVRDAGVERTGWTTLWLPSAHLIAFDDGQPGATFAPAPPALERALWSAARGHTARAARRFAAASAARPPAARVAEVVPAPVRASARATDGGPPALMWTGAAGVLLLLAAGAWRARRR
ncbi:MAG TPA: GPS-CTERM domain-containing protein [Solirubrobacteraceae bacterium]